MPMVGDFRGSYNLRSSEDSDDASSLKEETTSSMYSTGKDYIPIEWTDEKHSLYLKSMEASFIDHLYDSLGSNLNKYCGSHEFLKSPSIKQYKPLPKTQSLVTDESSFHPENQVVRYSSGSVSSLKHILWEGCSHSHEEVSDQNFVNELTNGENRSSKKMKISSSTDQVVPFRKTPANMT